MKLEMKERYILLVEFLGLVLSPSYEIALHDLSLKDKTIIAIANGHVTGRTVGCSAPGTLKDSLKRNRQKEKSYEVNYTALTTGNKQLRTSTLYIRDGGNLVGLLCITFDDTKFRNVSKQILGLCHPDELLVGSTFEKVETLKIEERFDIYQTEVGQLLPGIFESVVTDMNIPPEKMKRKDRQRVIEVLNQRGAFLVKGAIEEVARLMETSVPTIYRYLKEARKTSGAA